jgi:hypothetical protein
MKVLKLQRNNKEVEEDDILEDNEIDQNDEVILKLIEKERLEEKRIKEDKKHILNFSMCFFVLNLVIPRRIELRLQP